MHQENGHHHHHHLPVREHIRIAKSHLEAEDYEGAFRELSAAVHQVEDHDASSELEDREMAEIYLARASAQMSMQKTRVFRETEVFHQVLEDLDQAVLAYPAEPQFRLVRAQFYKQSEFANYLNEAKKDLEDILKAVPDHQEAMKELGDVLVRQYEFKDAIAILTQVIDKDADPEAYMSRGLAYFKKSPPDFAAAAKDFYQAQLASPNEENLYLWRAQCFQELGQWKDALREYDLLLTFATDNPGYYVDRGFIRDSMGDENGAFEDYNQALEYGENAMAFNNRAMHYLRLGQHEAAIEDAKAALSVDPELHIAHATLAEIYAETGDMPEMLHSLKHAMGTYYSDAVEVMLEPAFEAYLEDPDFLQVIGR